MIIDTQVHLWEPNRPERPWVDGGPHFPHPERAVAAEEVLSVMANAGVDRAIIVPPPWPLGVNEIALTAAASHPEKFRVMALFDPTGQDAASRLGALLEERYVVGIRMMFTTDRTIAWLDPGVLNWFWAAAQRLHVPLMLYPPRSCEKLHWIAEQYPDLTIILDHLCLQQRKRDAEALRG
jgi:L-fuconolactonase